MYVCRDSLVGKQSTCNAGDPSSIPGMGRSPGEGKGYPLQYSGLENSRDFIVHAVTKSQTRLSNFHRLSYQPVNTLLNSPRTETLSTHPWKVHEVARLRTR